MIASVCERVITKVLSGVNISNHVNPQDSQVNVVGSSHQQYRQWQGQPADHYHEQYAQHQGYGRGGSNSRAWHQRGGYHNQAGYSGRGGFSSQARGRGNSSHPARGRGGSAQTARGRGDRHFYGGSASSSSTRECSRCGSTRHASFDCPYQHRTCDFCQKPGHLQKKCWQKYSQ